MVATNARTAITFSLSPGQAYDSPEGRKLLNRLRQQHDSRSLIIVHAHEGDETRQLALALGYEPVVPPLRVRIQPRDYDLEMYKRRNEIERLYPSIEGISAFPIEGSKQHQAARANMRPSAGSPVSPSRFNTRTYTAGKLMTGRPATASSSAIMWS